MATSPHDAYLESRILTADPLELVRILYSTAIDGARQAREHMQAGNIAARAEAIAAASRALGELSGSLDDTAGGELSRRLARLYEYMQWRLVDANMQQSVDPLNEVLGLLTTLSEAWQSIRIGPRATAPPARQAGWADEPFAEAVQAWSA